MDGLKMIVEKLSQYNLMTNILPGTVLCIVLKYLIGFDPFITSDWYQMGIVFYFIGMVNNRFGSLVIECLLRKTKFVKFAEYKDFDAAEKEDSKLTTLSMENNVFRSYIALSLLSLLSMLFKFLTDYVNWINEWKIQILLFALFILFLFSYRKQTSYIRKRVINHLRYKEQNT